MALLSSRTNRILAVDWLRGLAVLMMIECHALWLLNPIHDKDPQKAFLQNYNGIPSAGFTFAAGFALALISGRVSSDPLKQKERMWRSLKRIGVVFIVSLVLHEHFWDAVWTYRERLIWPDVLTMLGYSMLIIWAALFGIAWLGRLLKQRTPIVLAVQLCALAALFGVFLFATPFVAGKNFGWITPLVNNSVYWDTWPLFPSTAYAMVGAIIGLATGASNTPRRTLSLMLGLAILLGGSLATEPLFVGPLFAEADRYPLIDFGQRIYKLSFITLALLGLESLSTFKPWIARNPITWLLDLFGTQSLVAYIAHLVFLFGWWSFTPLNRFHRKLDWPAYWWCVLGVAVATTLVCFVWQQFGQWLAKRNTIQPQMNADARR